MILLALLTAASPGASKLGGVAIIALVVSAVPAPSISATALIGAVPLVLGAAAMALFGVETRKRRLEEITAEELSVKETKQAWVEALGEAGGR